MPFVINATGLEKARVAAFNAIFKRIEVQDAGGAVLAKADIPADTEDATPNSEAGNKAAITLTPSASGTAATVKTFDVATTGGVETGSSPAADVMNSTNVQSGTNITIAINALRLTA